MDRLRRGIIGVHIFVAWSTLFLLAADYLTYKPVRTQVVWVPKPKVVKSQDTSSCDVSHKDARIYLLDYKY